MTTLDYDQFAKYGYTSTLAGTADWTYATFRDDIKACVDLAKQMSGASKVFMSSFSRGGFRTMAYAAKYWQTDLKGMISLDGSGLWRNADNPATQKSKAAFDQAVADFKAGKLAAPKKHGRDENLSPGLRTCGYHRRVQISHGCQSRRDQLDERQAIGGVRLEWFSGKVLKISFQAVSFLTVGF